LNEANVAALRHLLRTSPTWAGRSDDSLAAWLASRGVLVPSTLTDEQCANLTLGWDSGINYADGCNPESMRAELARIARGEP
jgi:hypothetical protein